jgi:MFS family permease
MFAVTSCQYIVTVWCTGPLANSFYDPVTLEGPGWRWAFGAWSIITPAIHAPLFALFVWNFRKAKKSGLMPVRPDSGRTTLQSIWYYVVQFDVFGILLACAGMSLFLLPFSLYYYQSDGWKSAMIICMLVFGVVFLVLFGVWERYFTPVTFMPFDLLKDRTVAGACLLSAVLFIEFYIWDSYFSSFLQAVNNLDLEKTGWVVNIYSVGACFWAIVAGYWIRVTGKFKAICLYFGVPITILGIALMIAFRQPDVNM